jgi:hypothetical protein
LWIMCAGLGVFQDVTMRSIAEQVVLPDAGGTTYVDCELVNQKLTALPPPSAVYHVYCSDANPGAVELLTELANERNLKLTVSQERGCSSHRPSLPDDSCQWLHKMLGKMATEEDNMLIATAQLTNLSACDHMLLYLTAQTWTRGAESDTLANEVRETINLGVHLLLAHESKSSRRYDPDPHDGCCTDQACACIAPLQYQVRVDRRIGTRVSSTASSLALRVRPPLMCCNVASIHRLLWLSRAARGAIQAWCCWPSPLA